MEPEAAVVLNDTNVDVAPPLSGSRIEDLGESLNVRFRPRREWGVLIFLAFWLTFWTFGGISAFSQLSQAASWGERAFLLVWLCAWVFGECLATVVILWQLFGREVLTVTPHDLVVSRNIARFVHAKRYDAALVQEVKAARVTGGEDEKPRKDFSLEISYDGKTVRVGEGMGEREAEFVAATVMTRIRPGARWSAERAEFWGTSDQSAEPTSPPSTLLRRFASALFPLFVVAVLAATVFSLRDHPSSPPTPPQPREEHRGRLGFPSPRVFPNPREYAVARTLTALTAGHVIVIGQPVCGARVTWTAWSCLAEALPRSGAPAGRTLTYRCHAASIEVIGGEPTARGLTCGLVNLPFPRG
jgi:hypothetical protein